jgi:hypothetical protein
MKKENGENLVGSEKNQVLARAFDTPSQRESQHKQHSKMLERFSGCCSYTWHDVQVQLA